MTKTITKKITMPRTAYLKKEERSEIKEILDSVKFPSRFNFLSDHKGLRTREISLLIAPKGGSKSTLVKTILSDLAASQKQCYVLLSEEDPQSFLYALNQGFESMLSDASTSEKFLNNIFVQNQSEIPRGLTTSISGFINYLREMVIALGIKAIIFDNISTSFLTRFRIDVQQQAIEELKELAIELDIAFLIVIHTAKGTNIQRNLFSGEDVRGNMASSNIASYIYALHTYFNCNPPRSFIYTDKARYHRQANKQVYELEFDNKTGLFLKDKKSSYDTLLNMISNRKQRKGVNENRGESVEYIFKSEKPSRKEQNDFLNW